MLVLGRIPGGSSAGIPSKNNPTKRAGFECVEASPLIICERMYCALQLVVVRHDVLVGAVGHAEAAGDDAQLGEAELLV